MIAGEAFIVTDPATRLARALRSLDGLSIGDAFGEAFYSDPTTLAPRIEACIPPDAPWHYTDDTIMAMSVVETLEEHGRIDQDALAARFGRKLVLDPWRGYGRVTHQIVSAIARGGDWRRLAAEAFGGVGSMGNGGAMRAGPIGAYFAGDLATAAAQARLSAEVTHANVEGQAGAMAVAAAAAWVAGGAGDAAGLFDAVLDLVPASETRTGIEQAAALGGEMDVLSAMTVVGNGLLSLSQDTVPLALWCVRHHLDDYPAALWAAVGAFGDADTLGAIVGGIVAMRDGGRGVPEEWRRSRESLSIFTRYG
jgi:ADP-ribosylglycohydrolase